MIVVEPRGTGTDDQQAEPGFREAGRRRRWRWAMAALVGLLACSVGAAILIPLVSSGGPPSWQVTNVRYQNEITTAASATRSCSVLAYQQSRYAGQTSWITTSAIIDGNNVAFFELPNTATLATTDAVLRSATSGDAPEVLVDCTLYTRQADGTYWMTSNVGGPFGPEILLQALTSGRFTSPITKETTSAKSTFNIPVQYTYGRSYASSNPRSAVAHVVINHGLVQKIELAYSAGSGPQADKASYTQTLFGGYGEAQVTAPPQRDVSKILPPVGKVPAGCPSA